MQSVVCGARKSPKEPSMPHPTHSWQKEFNNTSVRVFDEGRGGLYNSSKLCYEVNPLKRATTGRMGYLLAHFQEQI